MLSFQLNKAKGIKHAMYSTWIWRILGVDELFHFNESWLVNLSTHLKALTKSSVE